MSKNSVLILFCLGSFQKFAAYKIQIYKDNVGKK